jgi:hypothetical protein
MFLLTFLSSQPHHQLVVHILSAGRRFVEYREPGAQVFPYPFCSSSPDSIVVEVKVNLQAENYIFGQPESGDPKAGHYTGIAEFEIRLELKNG